MRELKNLDFSKINNINISRTGNDEYKLSSDYNDLSVNKEVVLNGDMANEFNDSFDEEDIDY